MAFDFTKILSSSKVEKILTEDFARCENEWKMHQANGNKNLREYIIAVDTLRRDSGDFRSYEKARDSHRLIKKALDKHEEVIFRMISLISSSRKVTSQISETKILELSDLDYLMFMEKKVDIYQNELDLKQTLFLGLSESVHEVVLSGYLIQWEEGVFVDKLQELEKEIERRNELHLKAKTT